MATNKGKIDSLILAYLEHELDNSGAQLLKNWISESAENAQYFLQIQEVWAASNEVSKATRFDFQKAYSRFNQRVRLRRRRKISFAYSSLAVVCAAVLCCATFFLGREMAFNGCNETSVSSSEGCGVHVVLPDGTEVVLNSNSELRYSDSFGKKDRNVSFIGEGYFEVARNEEIPFNVMSNTLNIEVLGTKFDVSDYCNEAEPCVTLLDGKLCVSSVARKDQKIILAPNQKAVLDKASGSLTSSRTSAKQSIEWMDGYLFFDDRLITDIANKIERYYGVKVVLASDEIKNLRFYGNFAHQGQSLEDILDALATTGKIRYIKSDNVVTLY